MTKTEENEILAAIFLIQIQFQIQFWRSNSYGNPNSLPHDIEPLPKTVLECDFRSKTDAIHAVRTVHQHVTLSA